MILRDAIIEALKTRGGSGSISEVTEYIHAKYGRERWKDIVTEMANMCPESQSSLVPMSERVLKRIGRGNYALIGFNP
ncbi:MAG: hypothetical protein QCH99_09945 [Candidatus Bathyarchaeota archaeon]|nr:hypothetical protein [Candidatus Bathyarchaeum tardum]